jgi:glycosyltransferase involved in cell wall biosynthesis
MACGKAVLCGVAGEAARIVERARAGVIFEADNDEQLGKLVLELLNDKTRVEKMGAHGLAYARAYFSVVTTQHKMELVLLAVANKKPST